MRHHQFGSKLRPALERAGPYFDGFLVFLSVVSVAFVVINSFLTSQEFIVPGINVSWIRLRVTGHVTTWLLFMAMFFIYGVTHPNRTFADYAKKWWLEAVICVTWMPFTEWLPVQQILAYVSVKTFILTGSVAHFVRVCNWVRQRFSTNPFIVLTSAMLTLVTVASAVMMIVEPQSFTAFSDTAFSVFMTSLSIGWLINPTTVTGLLVFGLVAVGSTTFHGFYYGVLREGLQSFVFGYKDTPEQLLLDVRNLRAKLSQEALPPVPESGIAADAVMDKSGAGSTDGGLAVRMFRRYPLTLLATVMLVMVYIVAVLLMVVEPESFNNLPKSEFSVFMTALGIGWLINPATGKAFAVMAFAALCGNTLSGIYYGVIREFLKRKVFKHPDVSDELLTEFAELKAEALRMQAELSSLKGQKAEDRGQEPSSKT